MKARTPLNAHPALASAARAIRRGVSRLTPPQVFQVAALVDTLQYGEDRWRRALSASCATTHPDRCQQAGGAR
jgi:hypothetical protein